MLGLILPFIIAAVLSAGLAVYIVRYRMDKGAIARVFVLQMLAITFWSTAYAIELSLNDFNLKVLFNQLKYVGVALLPVFLFLFSLYYTNKSEWLTSNRRLGIFVIPTITIVLAITNLSHSLMWSNVQLADHDTFSLITNVPNTWFWVHAVYSYVMLLVGTGLLIREFSQQHRAYRLQILPFVVAIFFPWVTNVLVLASLTLLDYTVAAFVVTGIAMYVGIFRFKMLDILPLARNYVLDMMEDAVIVIDERNRVIDINQPARILFPLTAPQAIGNPINLLIGGRYEHLISQYRDKAQVQEEIVAGTEANPLYFDVRISQMLDGKGISQGRVIVLRDVTARKKSEGQIREQNQALIKANEELAIANEKAEEAGRLKSEFLATMSHELRTPLNAIIGYTEIQLEGMTGELNKEQKDYQKRVLRNSEHLLHLINDILDLSKIEAGRVEIQKVPFSISNWMDAVIYQTKGLAEEKNLELTLTIDEEMPDALVGDPTRLKQIAINLLGNAIKFTDSGQVTIDVKPAGDDNWLICVKDTGIGIPPHMQEVIFQEFRQVDGSYKRNHNGTGLGLAIARKLIVLMDGSIHVKSEVGAGSEFVVTLPLKILKPTDYAEMVIIEETSYD